MHSKCPICQKELPELAKKCVECGAYQNKVIRNILLISRIVAGLTIITSAVIFSIVQFESVKRIFAWHDSIEIISFQNPNNTPILNTGHGPVVIDQIYTYATVEENGVRVDARFMSISKIIEEDEFYYHDFKDIGHFNKGYQFFNMADSRELDMPLDEIFKSAQRGPPKENPCFAIQLLPKENNMIALGLVQNIVPDFIKEYELVIDGRSLKTGEKVEVNYPLIGVLMRNRNKESCEG
ncbi:MAG: hypothetical protein COB20_10795 [SAR86 cluster bacterium]|uniref:Uncharacterized protein n=1 Tax=SAR86 cluster bacterium TaxID=2030880 RepID=A0A2A4X138_9GAMM|nr:MAG: hypothetical protein COB20_10795 [SAR86 cluster bacterium]